MEVHLAGGSVNVKVDALPASKGPVFEIEVEVQLIVCRPNVPGQPKVGLSAIAIFISTVQQKRADLKPA